MRDLSKEIETRIDEILGKIESMKGKKTKLDVQKLSHDEGFWTGFEAGREHAAGELSDADLLEVISIDEQYYGINHGVQSC